MLVLDAGNALFKTTAPPDASDRKRAELILKAMASSGTAAMAPGARDLASGVPYLAKAAKAASMTVLSANLTGPDGKRVFPASTVLKVAGWRVALIGASPQGPVAANPGYQGLPAAKAVVEEAAKARGEADVVVVLAAVPPGDAMALANEAGTRVDFVFQSHDPGGLGVQRGNGNFVVSTGERGRQIGRMIVSASGSGPFQDRSDEEQARKLVSFLDGQVDEARTRMQAAADPSARKELQSTLDSLQARRAQASQEAKRSLNVQGRTFSLDSLLLGPDIPGDPDIESKVQALEPKPESAHP